MPSSFKSDVEPFLDMSTPPPLPLLDRYCVAVIGQLSVFLDNVDFAKYEKLYLCNFRVFDRPMSFAHIQFDVSAQAMDPYFSGVEFE